MRPQLRSLDWKRGLGEMVIVVLGILIALGLDGWNDRRKDARARIEAMADLRQDLVGDTAGIHSTIARQTAVIPIVEQLLAVSQGAEWADSLPIALALANTPFHVFVRSDGTYRDLLSTGRIVDYVPKRARSLLALYAVLADGPRSSVASSLWQERLRTGLPDPLWRLGLPTSQTDVANGRGPALIQESDPGVRAFLLTAETRTALRHLRFGMEDNVNSLTAAGALAEQIIAVFENELAR